LKKKVKFRRRVFSAPQIAPGAVEEYLSRDLDDWRWIKDAPREALEEIVKEHGFRFHTKPRLHQLACFIIALKMHRFLFLLEMGSGKSLITLEIMRYQKQLGNLKRALVCVPNQINLPSWEDQILQHAPDLKYCILDGTRQQRYRALDKAITNGVDVCLINYAGLQAYMATETRKLRGRTARAVVADDAIEFAGLFNFLVLDEPHLVLSKVQSLTYTLTKLISWQADFCFATTGTPFGRDPVKAFPQFHVVDQGATLGNTLGMFHTAFYRPQEDRFRGIKWTFDASKRKRLHEIIQHRSIRYEDSEFSDLPMLMPSRRILVPLTLAQVKRYEDILAEGREAIEHGEQEATWIKLRQTASGYISVRGEDNEKLEIAFEPNAKALGLEEYLLELPDDEKIVVFHEYIQSGQIIQGVLKRLKIGYAGIGHGFKDARLNREKFMTSPSCRVFVANSKAGATGADGLQKVARYLLFYESPSSPDLRKQALKRLHRDGQQRRVYPADLVASNVAIDKRILASLEQGKDLFEAVCNGKEKLT
jgi:SNF2 family DNA or RNA helicase